ncbi:hypothetical protein C0581_02145 [Candidatus Parcubacteria bacterium]|nr:MAG: hypothetical protein C0581_02145 [Candidatus Parcubacteria bacterium]
MVQNLRREDIQLAKETIHIFGLVGRDQVRVLGDIEGLGDAATIEVVSLNGKRSGEVKAHRVLLKNLVLEMCLKGTERDVKVHLHTAHGMGPSLSVECRAKGGALERVVWTQLDPVYDSARKELPRLLKQAAEARA